MRSCDKCGELLDEEKLNGLTLPTPAAVLIYQLPEDIEEFKEIIKRPDYRRGLSDVWHQVRSKLKYEELSETESKCFELVRSWLVEAAEDYDLEIY